MKTYFKRRQEDTGTQIGTLFILFCILVALGMLLAFCSVEPQKLYAQEPYQTVAVRNFGKPMEPILPVFTNDPERIILSQNFYTTQPNARQTRNGVVSVSNYSSRKTAAADAITTIESMGDSAAIVFMAGGKWWYMFYGIRKSGTMYYNDTLATPREVRPYTPGVVTFTAGTRSIVGVGTKFTRHLQPGDTLYVDSPSDTFVVRFVISDQEIYADSVNDVGNHVSDTWDASRVYSGVDPFLYSSDKYAYTGSVKDAPQVIFNKDDSLFIRPLVMVDSFYVNAIAPLHYVDTTIEGDTLRRSFSSASGTDTVIEEIQLISRRAGWIRDQWLVSPDESPVSYFVRLGWAVTDNDQWGRFYTIAGNSDTAMYLAAWYCDSIIPGINPNCQLGRGDSMVTGDVAAEPWAYIYTSVGDYDVVVGDDQTDTATLYGRGAVWKVRDPGASIIDTLAPYNNLYFLHLTSDDISFPAYTAGSDIIKNYTIKRRISSICSERYPVQPPVFQSDLPIGDSIVGYSEVVAEGERSGIAKCRMIWGYWTIKSTRLSTPVQAKFVNDAFYPVRFARHGGDTTYFNVSSANRDMVFDTSVRSTANWEIVKVGMPSWGGMTSWGNPAQIVAWGDTTSPSMMSAAQANDPWNWTTLNDVQLGIDLNDPVVGMIGFDDQLLAFKRNSITSYDGTRLSEISQGDGLIARDALVADNKRAFWLDIDGPKMISRRDFSGYTIQKIGKSLDPVFNAWGSANFGASVVPFSINPAYRNQAVMRYNKLDEHIYLWFAEGSSTTNNRCLTFNVANGGWDGLFTNGATAAIPMIWKDTACLVFSKNDTARLMRTSLNWNDAGVGITAQLQSSKFWLTDNKGYPVSGTLQRVRFAGRGSDLLFDTLHLIIATNSTMHGSITASAADTITIDMPNSVADGQFVWYPSNDLTGVYWEWKLYVDGGTTGTVFAPYEMLFDFAPSGREK